MQPDTVYASDFGLVQHQRPLQHAGAGRANRVEAPALLCDTHVPPHAYALEMYTHATVTG